MAIEFQSSAILRYGAHYVVRRASRDIGFDLKRDFNR